MRPEERPNNQKVSRREALKVLGVAGAAAAAPGNLRSSSTGAGIAADVVVIGAGLLD
jgi:hypothetical protein